MIVKVSSVLTGTVKAARLPEASVTAEYSCLSPLDTMTVALASTASSELYQRLVMLSCVLAAAASDFVSEFPELLPELPFVVF